MAFEWLRRRRPSERTGRMRHRRVYQENRQSGYYDGVSGNIEDALDTVGIDADVNKTAVVEFALSTVARAFMFAKPMPEVPALTPLVLSMMARQALSLGNAVFDMGISDRTGALQLLPVASYSVVGEPEPETWRYELTQLRPRQADEQEEDKGRKKNVPWEGVVHVRYMPRPSAPWHGVSPLLAAGITADQLARIERSLSYDAGPASAIILAMPDGAPENTVSDAEQALSTGLGRINLLETLRSGLGFGRDAAPKEDWDAKRVGAIIPEQSIALWRESTMAILAAIGIPPSLYTSEGGAQREAHRRFYTNTVEPLGQIMAEELSEKFEQEITFDFPEVFRTDISARSRAYTSLVGPGVTMDPAEAKALVGFPN